MTRSEAESVLGMITGTWDMTHLDESSTEAWLTFLGQYEFSRSVTAYTKIRHRKERPTIADLRKILVQLDPGFRTEQEVEPEPEFPLELPEFVKCWTIARYRHGDQRVFAEQKTGYDSLQLWNPRYKTYVWPDQVVVDPDSRREYAEQGASLTPRKVLALISTQHAETL